MLRKLVTAAGSHIGSDCYTHAALGQVLLADLGSQTRLQAGFAAWRVGPGDHDVISHAPAEKVYVPSGAQGFPYHAWLAGCDHVIDFTTYQLREKARQLDALDGGRTNVEWCPDFLFLPRREIRPLNTVSNSSTPGVSYYEPRGDVLERLQDEYTVDEGDLAAARVILANPGIQVFGPNNLAGRAKKKSGT